MIDSWMQAWRRSLFLMAVFLCSAGAASGQSAGPGHCWHGDSYVAKNDLWYHFGRFARAVRDLDPPAEGFHPVRIDHPRLRVYALAGRRVLTVWCRDKENTWQTELAEHRGPDRLTDLAVDLPASLIPPGATRTRTYDPWADEWFDSRLNGSRLILPAFARSVVFRVEL